MSRVLIIGPAHPLRGGLATFNHRLAEEFKSQGDDCSIISYSLQYPGFLFPGTTQYSDEPPPPGIDIRSMINSVNPLNWIITGRRLRKWNADTVVVRFWLPFMGPALGTILRQVRNRDTRIICIADNVIPHEKRWGDRPFTRYFLKACDGFVTMSEKVQDDLAQFHLNKPVTLVRHPLYDSFGDPVPKQQAREYLGLGEGPLLLFFGFIRHYKGLDLLLSAMADERVRQQKIRLVVAGEFYEDSAPAMELIRKYALEETVILRTHFIPDSEVRYYLCAADCVVQPYRNATQSGVTPLAYHFNKPMIVTGVGGLPALVPHGKAGLVCAPDPASIAAAIIEFNQLGEEYFIPHLRSEKQKYSWGNLTSAIRQLAAADGASQLPPHRNHDLQK